MNTSIQSTIAALANIKTNSDGTLRAKVWTTKLAEELNSGLLTVTQSETDSYDITRNGKSMTLGHAQAVILALKPVYDNTQSFGTMADFVNSGFISVQQNEIARISADKAATALNGHVLTAAQYELSTIRTIFDSRAWDDDLHALVNELIALDALAEKAAKTQLLSLVHQLAQRVYPTDRRESVAILRASEEREAQRWIAFAALGLTVIPHHKTASFEVTYSMDRESRKAVLALLADDFIIVDAPKPVDDDNLRVVFRDKTSADVV